MSQKVLVAMSGGVDSSVVAYLLKKKGFEVFGITLKIFPEQSIVADNETGCSSFVAIDDARKVAENLNIPFYVADSHKLFEEKVIKYFTDEYIQGRTPNPCIACNQFIKFATLLSKASSLGIDYIATGHYAKIIYDDHKKRYLLKQAIDLNKDQTYVLYGLTQSQLARILMPLGEFTKPEIRKIAKEINLKVANKPESQEICFIPDNDYRNFIRRRINSYEKGPFLDIHGKRIGMHDGLPFYTIGQRKGLGFAFGYPVYVVDIIAEKNAVVIGRQEDLFSKGLYAVNNNFILIDKLEKPMEVQVKIRYKADFAPAVIIPVAADKVKVEFLRPLKAVTPGQAVVYYQEDLVVGGGTIVERIS